MSELLWGIKASLLEYVRGMPDGEVQVDGGAMAAPDGFRFPQEPASGELRFRGAVTLFGHDGMMRVVIRDPWLVEGVGRWTLTIADPDDPTVRLEFATIASVERTDAAGMRAVGTALTADGADLFFGPYREGTPLSDPVVRP